MKTRTLWMIPVVATVVAFACTPVRRRSADDDDDGSGSGSGGATNQGSGGAGTAVGGFGGASVSSSGASPPTSVTSGPATTTGPSNGICNSGLTSSSPALDACLTGSCCASFDACLANGACQACITGTGTGCETNSLYTAFSACSDDNCPTDMCGTGIGFQDSATQEPVFACNNCGDQFCCASLSTCVQGGSDPEIDTCLACLGNQSSAACLAASSTVRNAATQFNSCLESNCGDSC